jgi:hypothetical protein
MPIPHAAASGATLAPADRWRNVALLNGVSGVSQLAQFGVIYPLLAMWLDSHGMPSHRVGMVVASVWPGMLLGNILTPVLLTRLSARVVTSQETKPVLSGLHAGAEVGLISKPSATARRLSAAMLRWRCCSS